MFEGAPKSYKDPYWESLASKAAQDVGLPSGLLEGVLTRGERSNADQVSSAGAKTPFQVIPQTREALQKKYGVDAYASPESAAKAAALLLKESLDRNKGSIKDAVGEYIGGTNRKNWGPITNAYIQRVTGPIMENNTAKEGGKSSRVSELLKRFEEAKSSPKKNSDNVSALLAKFKKAKEEAQPDYSNEMPEPFTQNPAEPGPVENKETGLLDTLAGAGETALALGTGATTGLLGGTTGGLIGIFNAIKEGKIGTQEGVKLVQDSFQKGMQGGTYQPRTESGREMVSEVGEALGEALPPVMPIVGQSGAITSGVRPAAQAVKGTAQRLRQMGSVADETTTSARPVKRESAVAKSPEKENSETQAFDEVGSLVKKASSEGMGSQKAKEQLALMAKVNPEAKAAADRLGIELPADVFSDNPQVVAAAGLTRSAAGSESEAAWRNAVRTASDKADDVMNRLDASTDVSQVSENVRKSLLDTRTQLRNDATKIYSDVDAAVPKSTPVEMNALRQQLDQVVEEVGVSGLNSVEKRLKAMLDSGEPITYARLIREKSVLGDKVGGKSPLEADLDTASAKRLYGALAQDQIDNVGRIGGDELRTQLRGANALYAKERALAKRIVKVYGSETDGSIAALMSRAVKSSQRGDSRDLTKLLKVVPKALQKETLATAIMSNTRSKSGSSLVKGGFGFNEFSDFYRGLRRNSPVYNQVKQVMGEDAMRVMRDMYEVSKRVTDARANVLTTGKANQALVNAMQAEGVVESILAKASSGAGRAAATTAGATLMGPLGAGAVNLATDFLSKSSKNKMEAAGALFRNEKFQKMMEEAAKKPATSTEVKNAVKSAVRTKEFQRFAKSVNLKGTPLTYESFMLSAMSQNKREDVK